MTNKIYVANSGSNDVTIIDGLSNETSTISVGTEPRAIAINTASNKIYVCNWKSNNVTSIDGKTNATTTITTGLHPEYIVYNPINNRIYVCNTDDNNVTVISEQSINTVPVETNIYSQDGNATSNRTPAFLFSSTTHNFSSDYGVYYSVDTWQGVWKKPGSLNSFTDIADTLSLGTHTLYAFAADGMASTPIQSGRSSNPFTSAIQAYAFTVIEGLGTCFEKNEDMPAEYVLNQNYPNPFNPTTTINFHLPQNGFVTLKIYDILGKEIETLVSDYKQTGDYRINFDGSNLTSGIYVYYIRANNFIQSKKMMLIK